MTHAAINHLCVTRGGPVAPTVVRCAEKRTTLHDFARNGNTRLTLVETRFRAAASRVERDATRLRGVLGMPIRIPVNGPFPNVPSHVEETVTVCGKGTHGRGSFKPIEKEIFRG